MVKNYARKLLVLINILYVVPMFSSLKTTGSFVQPFIYCNQINGNISVVLPYQQGKCKKRGKDHLKKLTYFIQALNSKRIPETTSFKMFIKTIEDPTIDEESFAYRMGLLLATKDEYLLQDPSGWKSFLWLPDQGTTLIDAVKSISKSSVALMIIDQRLFTAVEQILIKKCKRKPCTHVTSSNHAMEFIYSFLYEMGYIKEKGIIKKCFSQGCNKLSAIFCGACNGLWYCSFDCSGYKDHVNECKGFSSSEQLQRMFNDIIAQQTKEGVKIPARFKQLCFTSKKVKVDHIHPHGDQLTLVTHVTHQSICKVCKTNACQRCHNCYQVFYCSEKCQKSDWKEHKKVCDSLKHQTKKADDNCLICKFANLQVDREDDFLREHKKHCGKPHCTSCKKLIDKILQCSQCKVAIYCSRECQKLDWKGGHKEECLAS